MRYFARSASDRTEDWPYWLVADRDKGGVNVTGELCDALSIPRRPGQTLCARPCAEALANCANEAAP